MLSIVYFDRSIEDYFDSKSVLRPPNDVRRKANNAILDFCQINTQRIARKNFVNNMSCERLKARMRTH